MCLDQDKVKSVSTRILPLSKEIFLPRKVAKCDSYLYFFSSDKPRKFCMEPATVTDCRQWPKNS